MNPTFPLYEGKSIRIAPDGFSLYRAEGDRTSVQEFPNDSGALLSVEAPRFFGNEDPVAVIMATHIPMLVPEELYDPNKDSDYLALQFDTSKLGDTRTDTLPRYRAVYFLTQNESNVIGRLPFPHQVISEAALMCRFLQTKVPAGPALFVALNPDHIDVVACQKGELMLMNRFSLVTPEDILFYLSHVIKQYNLRQPRLFLHFYTPQNKKLLQLLKTYQLNPETV